jgi:hypothetical protein
MIAVSQDAENALDMLFERHPGIERKIGEALRLGENWVNEIWREDQVPGWDRLYRVISNDDSFGTANRLARLPLSSTESTLVALVLACCDYAEQASNLAPNFYRRWQNLDDRQRAVAFAILNTPWRSG